MGRGQEWVLKASSRGHELTDSPKERDSGSWVALLTATQVRVWTQMKEQGPKPLEMGAEKRETTLLSARGSEGCVHSTNIY